jgi:hypothetical protein
MGNVCHAGPVGHGVAKRAAAAKPPVPSPPKKKPLTFGRDPTLKREDFVFSRIVGPSLQIKQPGSVNGQQFLVEECRDCDIFVLDHCTSVQIDECANCRIVIGPCQGSLFLRNCTGCTVVCAVQQFRARDCKDCDVYLYSATEPIIEASTKMRFACFPLTYFSLQQQFDKAKFSVWNNCWSEVRTHRDGMASLLRANLLHTARTLDIQLHARPRCMAADPDAPARVSTRAGRAPGGRGLDGAVEDAIVDGRATRTHNRPQAAGRAAVEWSFGQK